MTRTRKDVLEGLAEFSMGLGAVLFAPSWIISALLVAGMPHLGAWAIAPIVLSVGMIIVPIAVAVVSVILLWVARTVWRDSQILIFGEQKT